MKTNQQGFTLILLIITVVIIAIMAGLYFSQGENGEQSQFQTGQEGIEQAKEINNKSFEQAQQLNEQLEIQNELNSM